MKFIKKLRPCKETVFVWLYEEFYFEGKFKKILLQSFFEVHGRERWEKYHKIFVFNKLSNSYSLKETGEYLLKKYLHIIFAYNDLFIGFLRGYEPIDPIYNHLIEFKSIKHWKRYVKLQVFK